MKRRYFLQAGSVAAGTVVLSHYLSSRGNAQNPSSHAFEVTRADAEWRRILTPEQYNVLRQQGTEPPFSSALYELSDPGLYHCAACNLPLFSSATKFHSGTGWPSFYAPIENAIRTTEDHAYFMIRTEVHCRRCGGHLGHVFDDGPPPTGQRYCINGLALTFVAA